MKTKFSICLLALLPLAASAQTDSTKSDKGFGPIAIHGSLQSDILIPQDVNSITTYGGEETVTPKHYSKSFLTNTYFDLNLTSKYLEAGARLEYMENPLPGFYETKGFSGWGVPHIYVTGKLGGNSITLGDFYEQFGSGFILRTYEERSLGVDNTLRGGRIVVKPMKGLNLKVLAGRQRNYWDWNKGLVWGADAEASLSTWIPSLSSKGYYWTLGASFVGKHEKSEDIMISNPDRYDEYGMLKLPENVASFDIRTQLQKGNYSFLAEYAWKGQDPSAFQGYDNNRSPLSYIYKKGSALLLSASYSKRGLSALIQAKRSENMGFHSLRSFTQGDLASQINHLPAFSMQHTYSLASMYSYATQPDGEWALQGEFGYTFKRRTALGGKYGTALKLNVSYVKALKQDFVNPIGTSYSGTEGYTSKFFGFGDLNYQDINLALEKKITKNFKLNAMYMYQRYNQTVVEGEGGMINSHIFVADGKYQFSPTLTLRAEAQYLTTRQDAGDWAFGLLELSVAPYLMFSISDLYNVDLTHTHYYMAAVTGCYKAHRLMLSYGRTRAGMNCSGGVCRMIPATKGLAISYNFTF